jgi:hypothetical protein
MAGDEKGMERIGLAGLLCACGGGERSNRRCSSTETGLSCFFDDSSSSSSSPCSSSTSVRWPSAARWGEATVASVDGLGAPCFSSSTRRHSMAAGCGRFFLAAAAAAAGARAVVAPLRILERSSRSTPLPRGAFLLLAAGRRSSLPPVLRALGQHVEQAPPPHAAASRKPAEQPFSRR